jgi:hypothetical protein
MDKRDKDTLEAILDRYSMAIVIDALSEIAYDKSVHIAENWQDVHLAKAWAKIAELLIKFKKVLV